MFPSWPIGLGAEQPLLGGSGPTAVVVIGRKDYVVRSVHPGKYCILAGGGGIDSGDGAEVAWWVGG